MRLRGNYKLILGAACRLLIVALATLGGFFARHGPLEQDLMASLQPPDLLNPEYPFGTDQLGRDVFSRMVSGARVSLAIAAAVVFISGGIGLLLGAYSGFVAGARDTAIQKLVETVWAFPPILLAITVLTFFGQSLPNVILALSLQRWIPYTRVARAQALTLRDMEYVSASRIMGGGTGWILTRHILPNLIGPAIVVATFSMATAILAESSLSFLGIGVPPEVATYGSMLADGRSYVTQAWWLAVFPGVGIFVTVLGLNLIGDALRDMFDPKSHLNVS
ncbi:MAG: oligopeptide permease OppC [Hyphomicrobiales bacterium]|nr:oligopeptide permease OppC [Hyphomicrobiales bacterium]